MSIAVFQQKAPIFMRRLMDDFGFSAEDAAAVMGNAGHESGGLTLFQESKPTVKGSRGGWGWFQWTGPRRKAFEAWCARKGFDLKEDEAQYSFLYRELKGAEKKAVPATKNAIGLDAKVKAFESNYERAGVKHYPSRLTWAQRALKAFQSTAAAAKPPGKKVWPEELLTTDQIRDIQLRLQELGYAIVGHADGAWGTRTETAVKALQKTARIREDGHWGPETEKALADEANKAQVSVARAETDANKLREDGAPIVLKADKIDWAQWGTIIVSGIAIVSEVLSNIPAAQADMPFWLSVPLSFAPGWVAPIAAVAFAIFTQAKAKGIIRTRVREEQTGVHNGELEAINTGVESPDRIGGFFKSIFGGK